MTRETVHYHQGRAAVTRQDILRADAEERWASAPHVTTTEVWEGPEQELRARLRDEARDRRVKPYGDPLDRPGLPRGWVAMRVHLTDGEVTRQMTPRRRVWPWAVFGVGCILSGIAALGWWVYGVIAAAVAGMSLGTMVGVGIVAALLLSAAGGTTIIRVVTEVTIKK
jgi:hypothetical protein